MPSPILPRFAALCLAASGAAAQALPLYDSFSTPWTIDPAKWQDTQVGTRLQTGKLELSSESRGASGDSGLQVRSNDEWLIDPRVPKAMKATLNINDTWADVCVANQVVGFAGVRLLAALFNADGLSGSGSAVGDVVAEVRIGRYSNSADADGTSVVQGLLSRCTNSDCSERSLLQPAVDLGSATLGQKVPVEWSWTKSSKSVVFSRSDTGAQGSLSYGVAHSQAPRQPHAGVSVLTEVANCSAGTDAVIDAFIDNFGAKY